MKRHTLFSFIGSLLLILLFSSCQTAPKKTDISLSNTSSIDLTAKAISIERSQLSNLPEGAAYPLIISAKGDTVASQLDDLNGDKQWNELFFVVDLPANGTETFSLQWVKEEPNYVIRTNARFGKRSSANTPVKPATDDTLYAK
ncbi:MAG TPA: DUF4861 family protein, partial [Chitinophagaceae bacterium]|nr:DUF4861 family protein [Chitinophagaceae bacterium]